MNIYKKDWDSIEERELKKLKSSKINETDLQAVLRWHRYLTANEKIGPARRAKLVGQARVVLTRYKYPLTEMSKDKLEDCKCQINKDMLSTDTKSDYRRFLLQFYAWYREENENKEFYKYLDKNVKRDKKYKQIDPTAVLTPADINRAMESCTNAKEKAMISCLYESGTRIGEFLNIRIKDIIWKKEHALLSVDGKTGKRLIPIMESIPYIRQYLEIHPNKNPESYLWITQSTNWRGNQMSYIALTKMMDSIFSRASITKRHNAHWFRHSRATELAVWMTEPMLCKFFGWVLGSSQVRTYVHLNSEQIENVFLKNHGIVNEQEKKSITKKCICGVNNPQDRKYCSVCYRPMNMQVLEERDAEFNRTIQVMMEVASNPDLMSRFKEFQKAQSIN